MIGISKLYMGQAEASDPLRYGHKAVGTCQFTNENMDEKVPLLLDEIINYK